MTFEKAYCEYKLNRIDDCLLTLATIEEPALREKELKAQALYRKETFGECYETYIDLIRNSSDEYEAERTTNLAAAIACMSLINDPRIDNIPEIQEITFEQHYNKACYLLGAHHFDVAINKLKTSESRCLKLLYSHKNN